VGLIIPCRGVDYGLHQNLESFLEQNYPNYHVVFVVDSKEDSSFPVIEKVLEKYPDSRGKVVVSDMIEGTSGKISALIKGVHEIGDAEVLVFGDSDIRPGKSWLNYLTVPLDLDGIGATTGYRWYFPDKGGFSSTLRSSWNAVGLGILFNHKLNFVWGGSMAISREVFDRIGIVESWSGSLSDDYVITHAVKKNGYKIQFVPRSVAPSIEDCTFSEFLEWSTKEISLVKVLDSRLWGVALGNYLLSGGITFLGAVLLVHGVILQVISTPALLMLIPIPLGVLKNYLRMIAFRSIMPHVRQLFDINKWGFLVTTPLVSWILLYNFVKSIFIKRINWRGRTYNLRPPYTISE